MPTPFIFYNFILLIRYYNNEDKECILSSSRFYSFIHNIGGKIIMGRIKTIDNAFGINIHVTKEFVRDDDTKIIVGELTNWFGDNLGPEWVKLTMNKAEEIIDYSFGFSEAAVIGLFDIKFNDADRDITIDYHDQVESITGWSCDSCIAYNFQTSVLDSYMYYEAIYVDNIDIIINGNNFAISGNVFDITNDELLFYFKAVPGINSYDIDYYTCDGKKIDALEMANIEASKICGAGNEDVDNAIYYVISSKIYDAMIETLPISILIKACYSTNDAHKKNLTVPTAKEYIKGLFNDGVIDRFLAEFMMSLIGVDGNIRT